LQRSDRIIIADNNDLEYSDNSMGSARKEVLSDIDEEEEHAFIHHAPVQSINESL
jgi:hypothetical protein